VGLTSPYDTDVLIGENKDIDAILDTVSFACLCNASRTVLRYGLDGEIQPADLLANPLL